MVGRWKAENLFEEANEKLDFARSRSAYTIFIINCQCQEISQRLLRAMAN